MRPADKALTIAEIEKRFDSEWMLIGDPTTDKSMEVSGGKVLSHSRDRDEVYREAVRLKPHRFAILYLGQMPTNAVLAFGVS